MEVGATGYTDIKSRKEELRIMKGGKQMKHQAAGH
jgi:hypothetical protein